MFFEWMNVGGNAHMINIPVIISQKAIATLHCRIKEQLKALIFSHFTADLVGIDHKRERWPNALAVAT